MKRKMDLRILLAAAVACAVLVPAAALAHCEIPCGIYTDDMRIRMIEEDCQTIEKAMLQIDELSAEPGKNANQLVRWITNKEEHANKIQHVVTQYFMTQRIKPDQEQYDEKLQLLHKILLEAMKCKQTTDAAHVTALREHLASFTKLYFGEEEAKHLIGHHD